MQILWWNMYPQSELDNYKLQVDLLQDKLKRSEENRQQLEQELKQILQKRSELDKATRAKQRQKYQSFMDEQKRRNERNQLLLQMLERIDQQTTALTARSERLKMMKLQYERYFAKLMQTQPIRCIQDTSLTTTTPGATPIPVLLPAAPATAAAPALCTSAPIKSNWHETAIPTTTLPTANTMMPPTATPSLTPRMWTLAMATPTPAGLLLTGADAAAAATLPATPVVQSDYLASSAANSGYDYLPYPASCMPLMQQQQQLQQQIQQQLQQQLQQQQKQLYEQQQQLQQPTAPVTTIPRRDNALLPVNRNVADTDPATTSSALQAFEKMQEAIAALANGEGDAASTSSNLAAPEYDNGIAAMAATTTTLPSTPAAAAPTTPAATATTVHKDNEQRPLSVINNATSAKPVAAASPLTFDKLPTTLTDVAAPSTAALPQLSEKNMANDDSEKDRTAEAEEKFQYLAKALDVVGPLTASVTDSARYAVSGGNVTQLPPRKSPDRWQPEVQFKSDSVASPNGLLGEGGVALPGGLSSRFEEILKHTKANKINDLPPLAAVAAASAVGPQLNASAQLETKARQPTTAKVSIENIENAIYGELVNPPMEDDDKPQSYFADLMGQQQKPQEPHLIAGAADAPQQKQLPTTAQQREDYVNYAKTYADTTNASADDTDAISSVSESVSSYRPDDGSATYAPEYGTTSADVHTPTRQTDYASDANYAQYAPEGSDQTQQQQSEPEQQQTEQQQQDYAQLDYGNYDATQYTNYDPNAYPGYTYNEATGEYTPDPQYETAAADGYGEQQQQQYDEQQQQYEAQQYADQQQQQQQQYDDSQQQQQEEQEANYDYDGYAPQETTATAADGHVAAMAAEPAAAAATSAAEAPNADSADSNVPAPNVTADTPKVLKPTSILASADKHAASNDAQKKKKRVNFVDSSETDDSSSAKPAAGGKETGSESDFDFSNSGDAPAGN